MGRRKAKTAESRAISVMGDRESVMGEAGERLKERMEVGS